MSIVDKSRATTDRGRRVCQHPECKTVLSRYNTQPWCAVHAEGKWRPREPRSTAVAS
jgi:hypothetical protein